MFLVVVEGLTSIVMEAASIYTGWLTSFTFILRFLISSTFNTRFIIIAAPGVTIWSNYNWLETCAKTKKDAEWVRAEICLDTGFALAQLIQRWGFGSNMPVTRATRAMTAPKLINHHVTNKTPTHRKNRDDSGGCGCSRDFDDCWRMLSKVTNLLKVTTLSKLSKIV